MSSSNDPDAEDRAPGLRLNGRLLVATAKLGDPNFERGVILMLEHGDEGALGLVLNRPTGVEVKEILEPWQDQAGMAPPGVIFAGGPVSREAVIGLGRRAAQVPPVSEADSQWRTVLGSVGTVDLSVPPGAQPFSLDGARLFSGYAGWSPGQLEGEVEDGAWYVVDAMAQDLLCEVPDRLWHDVLRRQGGRLALLAAYPPHPSVN